MNFLSTITKVAVVFSLILVSCKPAEITQEEPESTTSKNVQEEVIRLIRNMPAEENQEEIWVNEQLVGLGADAVHVLSGMLVDPAVGSDLQARYALSSLANYAARPGASSEKRVFESAMLSEIQKDHSQEVKSFLMEQLRLVASDRSVPVLENYLTHDNLSNDALKVLLTIDSPLVASSIRQTVPASDGPQKIALIKALGELKDSDSVEMIQDYAGSDDWPVVRTSLFALSNIGEPGASLLYEQSIEESNGFRRSEIISFYLDYAEALQANGYVSESEAIAESFLNGDTPPHIKSSALQIRFEANGAEMSNELIEIAQSSEDILAKKALRLLNELEGEDITTSLMDVLKASSEPQKIYFIEALGDRGDVSAVSGLNDQTENGDREIRIAALHALHQIQGEIDPELVLEVLEQAETNQEIQNIEDLLLQLEPNETVPVAVNSLPEVESKIKPVLINLLAVYRANDHKEIVLNEWESDDEAVRVAVSDYLGLTGDEADIDLLVERMDNDLSDEELQSIQSALASVLNRSDAETERDQLFSNYYNNGSSLQKERLTGLVPYVDGIDHVGILEASLEHANAGVRFASVDVIGQWNSTDLLPMFNLAVSETSRENQLSLITNFSRIVSRSDKSLSEKEEHIHKLFSDIDGNEYNIELLKHIAENNERLALQTVTQYLDHENEDIRKTSIRILSEILEPHYSEGSEQLNMADGILAVLDEEIRDQVKNEMSAIAENQLENQEELDTENKPVFGTLFNGENLDGWQVIGSQEAWGVEGGILNTDGAGSGWISTESQYDDFIIELEYRVPEGGNSGLFLRAPHEGNPANQGLEIQILDDYAERYAELKPWQYTGSIYFEQAVSKRVTKPAGEWQAMKVRADGPNIQVTVNGEMVINTSLVQYMENASNHPGLLRRSGYIGLQNHGERVDFRNIKISRID